jgi:hypothetical protein
MVLAGTAAASLLARAAPWIAALAAGLGLALYVQWVRWDRDVQREHADRATAELSVTRAAAEIAGRASAASLHAVAAQAAGDRARAENLERDLEKIRHAKAPIPDACRDALRPLDELARQLQPGPVPAPGGASGPRPARR